MSTCVHALRRSAEALQRLIRGKRETGREL
jgi:hypothetical protein